jgi:AcrR family transcriptional regulator
MSIPPMAERRRDFVRLEIERAGMDLFAERGYGNVTVQDIAAAAGIGRRTFFRHFRSKEELLQAYDTRLATRALHALERRPADEPAAAALCNALVFTADIPSDQERIAFQRNKVLQEAGADTLIAGPAEVGQAFVDSVAKRLAVDADEDVRPLLIVWTVFAAARAATRFWIATDAKEPLKHHLESAFQDLRRGLDSI